MKAVVKKIISLAVGAPQSTSRSKVSPQPQIAPTPTPARSHKELIQRESVIGRQLFGPIPEGHSREFFCLDADTWVWHEEWTDQDGKEHTLAIRYEVHPNGILKIQNGVVTGFIEGEELDNLHQATKTYRERVVRYVYGYDPDTGLRLDASPATIR